MKSTFGIAHLSMALPGVAPSLRFCLDPNNLPFSNNRAEGFENRIATSPLPLSYDISMGLRKRDIELKNEVARALERNKAKITKILKDFNVPLE